MFKDLPSSGLVILMGAPASGKSTFARLAFPPEAVLESDRLRHLAGIASDTAPATDPTFEILVRLVRERLRAGLLTVIDSTGTHQSATATLVDAASDAGAELCVIRLSATPNECIERDARRGGAIPRPAIEQMANLVADAATWFNEQGTLVTPVETFMPSTGRGRRIFLAMPVTENIGKSGFRRDKRKFYTLIHDALKFFHFNIASAAVNEEYGTINLEPAVFTEYDLEMIAACDALVVATPTTLSPDVYLEIGLARGAGKPVGIVMPEGTRYTAMMRGMVELGGVKRVECQDDADLPYLTTALALTLVAD